MDTFTVITPSYNSPHIFETIESVLMQDYPNIEYIIIDDGSKKFDEDKIKSKFTEYTNVKPIIIRHLENQGTVKTLNDAIRASSGKYIFELAADDLFYSKHVLSDLYHEFESKKALVITGSRMNCSKDSMKEMFVQPSTKIKKLICNGTNSELFERLCFSNEILGCCTAYSRLCTEQYGLYDESYRLIEDYPRYLYLVRSGVKIHFIDSILVKYRQGGISSLDQYNTIYEIENNLVYEKEIFPYAKKPKKVKRYYEKWKKRRTVGSHLYNDLQSSSNVFHFIYCVVKYAFKSPYMVALYMKERLHKK